MFERADRQESFLLTFSRRLTEEVRMKAKGVDIIDLGIGDPDLPTPAHIIEALQEAVSDSSTHRYLPIWHALSSEEL